MERIYKVTTVLEKPFVMKNSTGGYEGFLVDMLDKIAEGLNIKYALQVSKDGRYGSLASDGRWNGMIGELVNREVDMAAAALTVTTARERVVDFTKPYMSNSVRPLIKKPGIPDISLSSLFEPFSTEVWFFILIAAFLVAVLFMLIGRFDPYEWRQIPSDKDPRGARNSFGLRDSLMFVFSTLFLQGYRETPRSLAGRTLAVFWFAFVLITLVAYIGSVSPFLRISRTVSMPFSDLDDLSRKTYIQVGAIESGSTYRKLENSQIDTYQRIYQNMKSSNSMVKTMKEGVDKVRRSDGKFVMLVESMYGKYVAETDRSCSLMMHGPSLFSFGMALAVPIGSSLRDRLNMMILSLREDGTLQHLQTRWWEKGMCYEKEGSNLQISGSSNEPRAHVLGMRNLAAPFVILLVGAILSVLVLVGEFVFKKFRQ